MEWFKMKPYYNYIVYLKNGERPKIKAQSMVEARNITVTKFKKKRQDILKIQKMEML